jgi:hypothetical protein
MPGPMRGSNQRWQRKCIVEGKAATLAAYRVTSIRIQPPVNATQLYPADFANRENRSAVFGDEKASFLQLQDAVPFWRSIDECYRFD